MELGSDKDITYLFSILAGGTAPYAKNNSASTKVASSFFNSSETALDEPEKAKMVKLKFKIPLMARQFLAEFLGTFLLVLFGDGAIAQHVGMGSGNDFLNVALGYGLALMIGILATGGVSGAHLNPAVTLSMAVVGKLKIVLVPVYMIAQYLGAFVASVILYANYYKWMDAQ